MEIVRPSFVPKSGYFITNLGRCFSQKVGILLIFKLILRAVFLTKCLLFQTRNQPLSLPLAFLAVVFSQFVPISLKVAFFTKKAPQTTISHCI